MFYVTRNENNQIEAVYKQPHRDATECLPKDHQEIREFFAFQDDLSLALPSDLDLSLSDLKMVRVLEDLIDVLVDKHLICLEDFPDPVVQKLFHRKKLRQSSSQQ